MACILSDTPTRVQVPRMRIIEHRTAHFANQTQVLRRTGARLGTRERGQVSVYKHRMLLAGTTPRRMPQLCHNDARTREVRSIAVDASRLLEGRDGGVEVLGHDLVDRALVRDEGVVQHARETDHGEATVLYLGSLCGLCGVRGNRQDGQIVHT